MKKTGILLLSVMLLCGCGTTASPESTTAPAEETASQQEKTISTAQLQSYMHYHSVTPDNWEDYFTCQVEDIQKRDIFGEEGLIYITGPILRMKDGYIYGSDLVMRFTVQANAAKLFLNHETGEEVPAKYGSDESINNTIDVTAAWIERNDSGTYIPIDYRTTNKTGQGVFSDIPLDIIWTYTLNDLKMVKSIGSVYSLDIPDDVWNDDGSGQYIVVDFSDMRVNPKSISKVYFYRSGRKTVMNTSGIVIEETTDEQLNLRTDSQSEAYACWELETYLGKQADQ